MTAVRVHRGDLAWAIKAVLPHAARDTVIPVLAAVRIEAAPDGTVYAAATDRFTIASAWIPGARDTTGPAATALLTVPDARELARRMAGGGHVGADLKFYGDELAVDYRVRYAAAVDENRSPYPDWRLILAQILLARPALPVAARGLNPEYLGRFASARRPGNTARALTFMPVSKGIGDLVCMVLGEQFAGAVNGAQLWRDTCAGHGSPAEVRADWLARIGAAT